MFFLTATLVSLIIFMICKVKLSKRHNAWATFPRPSGNLVLHNSLQLVGDKNKPLLETLTQWHDELGEVYLVTKSFFDCGTVVVADPAVAEAISLHQPDRTRSMFYTFLSDWIGKDGFFLTSTKSLKPKLNNILNAFNASNISMVSLI